MSGKTTNPLQEKNSLAFANKTVLRDTDILYVILNQEKYAESGFFNCVER